VVPIRSRYTFFIDPDQRAALTAIKARDGIPESEQIRRAITAWIAAREGEGRPDRPRVKARKRS
jgi:hypothetical protein